MSALAHEQPSDMISSAQSLLDSFVSYLETGTDWIDRLRAGEICLHRPDLA